MLAWLRLVGWLACVVYATIPGYWFLVHPFAEYWRSRKHSPYFALLPAWIAMWIGLGLITAPWRSIAIYSTPWSWISATALFGIGFWIYFRSSNHFSTRQLGGLPEVLPNHGEQSLVTAGMRAHIRHPVYLAHLCEMLAWSIGTGLAICYGMTFFAVLTGSIMIRMEDKELERRFGAEYAAYRERVPAVWPWWGVR